MIYATACRLLTNLRHWMAAFGKFCFTLTLLSLALKGIFVSSDWPTGLLLFWLYNRKALYSPFQLASHS